MDTDIYVFKVKYGNGLRRIRVSRSSFDVVYGYGPNMTFNQLEDTIRRAFKIPATSELAIVYTDKDNDEVTMVDDGDMRDACVYQSLNPVRMTVLAEEPHRSAHDGRPHESLPAGDPPAWAADIILKLDQLLLAVNKEKPTMTEHHVLEGVDTSPIGGSTIKPAKDVMTVEEWTDIAQPGYDSEFLRRAMILRQRVMTDELSD